ncbi:MAG: hypothetical protein WAZ18_01925 [Alphaproteobacteria bacterium]
MAHTLPPLEQLLELEPAQFAVAVAGQPEEVKSTLRNELEKRLAAVDAAAWGTSRNMRGHKNRFDTAKFDYTRLEQTQQWLASQFHEAFATIYEDAAAASAKCWAYEQQHGAAQTGRMLKDNPALFGALRGWSLAAYQSPARVAAVHHAARFDFAAYRLVFNLASETGKSLLNALKETARVANA